MKTFVLRRDIDHTGISGTGVVAEGIEFTDGTAAVRWLTEWRSTVFYEQGMEAVEKIHGHGGDTQIVWTSRVD